MMPHGAICAGRWLRLGRGWRGWLLGRHSLRGRRSGYFRRRSYITSSCRCLA